MCGIFGIISTGKTRCPGSLARRLVESFYDLSESRGKEAAGAALLLGDRIEVVKAPVRGRDFLALRESKPILDGLVSALGGGDPVVLIGHTRMVTNGGDHVHGNNQPVIKSELVAIHNGIIVNEQELWARLPDEQREFEVDTEVLLALVARQMRNGCGLSDSVSAGMRELKGANSIALMSSRYDGLVLATANGSMFLAHDEVAGVTVFASERSILERIIEKRLHTLTAMTAQTVRQILPEKWSRYLWKVPRRWSNVGPISRPGLHWWRAHRERSLTTWLLALSRRRECHRQTAPGEPRSRPPPGLTGRQYGICAAAHAAFSRRLFHSSSLTRTVSAACAKLTSHSS